MAAQKSWLKILAGIGCLGIIMAGCFIGLIVYTLSDANLLKPFELDSWAKFIGTTTSPTDLPECRPAWATSPDKTKFTCDRLYRQLPFAPAEKTAATVYLNKNKRIKAIEFELHGNESYLTSKKDNKSYYETWSNTAFKQIHAKLCPKHHANYASLAFWQCDTIAYGLGFSIFTVIGDAEELPSEFRGYLWIAKNVADFEPHTNIHGQFSAQQNAILHSNNADHYIKQKNYSMADAQLIKAAYFATQAMTAKKPSALTKKTMKDIAKKRTQIHAKATLERKQKELEPWLPSGAQAYVDLPFMMNKTQANMKILLGPPTTCKTTSKPSTGPIVRCTYGDKIGKAEISFIKDKSAQITLTLHPTHLEFTQQSLAKLQIQVQAPTKSTSKKLTWKSIANFKELAIEQTKTKHLVITAHTR